MFRNRMLKMLYWSCYIGRIFGGASYRFDVNSKQFYVDLPAASKLKRNFALLIIWNILALVLAIKKSQNHENLDDFHLTLSFWLGITLLLMVYSLSRFHTPKLLCAKNKLFRLLYTIQDEFMPHFDSETTTGVFLLLEILLALMYASIFSFSLLGLLLLLYDPRGTVFIGGLIPQKYFTIYVAVPVILYHAYMIAVVCSNLSGIAGPLILFMAYIYFMIARELRVGGVSYLVSNEFRNARNTRIFYTSFQIIIKQCMITCYLGVYVLVAYAIFMMAGIYVTFVLIRYWEQLQPIPKAVMVLGDFMIIGYWTLLLQIGCRFYIDGSKTLGSWKRHNWGFQEQNRLMKKFIRSCTLILISYGNTFVIGRKTVMSYYKGVEKGTFRALLATK